MALLAGVVAYLALNLRHYQRVDYSNLLEQDHLRQRMETRISHLEDMIARLAEVERTRRVEFANLLSAADTELKSEVRAAREQILREVMERPATLDDLLLRETALRSGYACEPASDVPQREMGGLAVAKTLHSPRQQQVSELLELGYSHQDISRILEVSRHEVELISTLLFQEEPV